MGAFKMQVFFIIWVNAMVLLMHPEAKEKKCSVLLKFRYLVAYEQCSSLGHVKLQPFLSWDVRCIAVLCVEASHYLATCSKICALAITYTAGFASDCNAHFLLAVISIYSMLACFMIILVVFLLNRISADWRSYSGTIVFVWRYLSCVRSWRQLCSTHDARFFFLAFEKQETFGKLLLPAGSLDDELVLWLIVLSSFSFFGGRQIYVPAAA